MRAIRPRLLSRVLVTGICVTAMAVSTLAVETPFGQKTEDPSIPSNPAPAFSTRDSAEVPASKAIVSQSTGMKLELIPAGTFLMGASAADVKSRLQAGAKDEEPRHAVNISRPFYMGVYEVTQGEYESVMGTNPSAFSKTGRDKSAVTGLDTSKFPVETVSWFDAVEFCNKLSEHDGLAPYYVLMKEESEKGAIQSTAVSVSRAVPAPGMSGYRLPTEAEWEHACRAGSTTMWHTGEENILLSVNAAGWWGALAKPAGNSEQRTNRVGQKTKNAFGLYDMHGNAEEWCFDVYDGTVYSKRLETTLDPMVISGSEKRVLRGGSWLGSAGATRAASRYWSTPVRRDSTFGFRVAR